MTFKLISCKGIKLISIVTKLAEDVKILKSEKGVLIDATSPIAATHPVVFRVPIDATPPVDATPYSIVTSSSANTLNMPTNDGYWYNYHEGGGVPNDGNDGHRHSFPANEDNSIPR